MIDRLKILLFAIRDAFILLLPLVFLRSILVLFQNIPWSGYRPFMDQWLGGSWVKYIGWLSESLFSVWILGVAGGVALMYHRQMLFKRQSKRYLSPTIVCLLALFNLLFYLHLTTGVTSIDFDYSALVPAIIAGLTSPPLFALLMRLGISTRSRSWYQQDVFFYRAIRFTVLFIWASLISTAVIFLWTYVSFPSLEVVHTCIHWLQERGSVVWWLTATASLINQIFWFFGINGTLILTSYFGELFDYTSLPYSHNGVSFLLFNTFILLGGAGATLGLVFAILLTCQQGVQKRVSQLALIPSLFNINEIILLGLPVVLNPVYFAPFLIVPLVLSFVSIFAVETGFITLQMVDIPWTTPPLISGWLLTGSWKGAFLQIVELIIATAVYVPFVKRAERRLRGRQRQDFSEVLNSIVSDSHPLQRHDDVGLIARNLFIDLQEGVFSQQFSLVYQPKHDTLGRVTGVEALLRWNHPYYGHLSPVIAVSLAEKGHFINELGGWVIDEACNCKARWNRERGNTLRKITMAINISPLQLLDKDLPTRFKNAIKNNGLQPEEIEIEVTESQSIPDSPIVDATFHSLSALGVRLSIDDFGMGFASLRYLKRFDVGVIKIDGSLTKDILGSSINVDIVKSITSLGNSRGILVVAEFVETYEQQELLKSLGCDVFQGYFHSPPIKEAAFLLYLDESARKGVVRRQEANKASQIESISDE